MLNISEKFVIYARLRLHVFLLKYHVVFIMTVPFWV